ncbi:radical SAM protein [Marinilabilia sp.]|uniref:radical SAM/SPASM domain-containing protein n=1 Tax=Marinilabilia sp. TaxID=2021252 RepID=UPI0025BFE46D|nr:radical SAM protein [Marinilabilia sp.]
MDETLFAQLQEVEKSGLIEDSFFTEEEVRFFEKNYVFVFDDDLLVEQLRHQSLSRIFDKKHMVLTIAPTHNCNFNCGYCYEKWRNPGRMSDETEDAIVQFLKKRMEQDAMDTLNLTWYGGEPLLETKRLLSLGLKIKGLGLNVLENEIVTNGYLLDSKRIEVLSEIGVDTIQVTLDGLRVDHDKRRPLLNGNGTFDKIVENLDGLFSGKFCDSFFVAVRVNIDKSNQVKFWEVFEWLNERYPSKNLVVYPGWIHLEDSNPSKCNCFGRNESTDFCISALKERNVCLEKIYPDDINVECLVRNPNNMIIGWRGEIYKCFEDLGETSLVVGNIHDDPVFSNHELQAKYSVGIDHYQEEECQSCSYLPICHGGCPKRRMENKYEGKNNDCCTPFKGRIEDYLELL